MPWKPFAGTIEHGEPRWWSCFLCEKNYDEPLVRCPACGAALVPTGDTTTIRHADGEVKTLEPEGPPVFVRGKGRRPPPDPGEN